MLIEEIERAMAKGEDIEDLLERVDWKSFERFCSQVFQRHGWETRNNFRFKTKRWFEIDVLARKGGTVMAADCKHWGIRPGKASQLRIAAEKQAERCRELARQQPAKKVLPMIITLLQEDVRKEHGAWIVPAFRLNSFLLEAGLTGP